MAHRTGIQVCVAGIIAATLLYCGGRAAAQGVQTIVDGAFFEREVRPLLQQNCLGCHGVGAKLSGLDMHSRAAALQGGLKGSALVPGSAAKSLLYRMVTGERTPQMPPTGKLRPAEIQTLKRWLDGGAPWSGDAIETAQKQVWWSFKRPVKPPVPVVSHEAIGGKQTGKSQSHLRLSASSADKSLPNPIDAFLLAKLRSVGLAYSPPASKRVLIRRATLDLIGLPPTPDEVRAFENDRSPNAYEKVVDRLLASPRYGERWGRHWLDVVRYADSGGFEGDRDRAWAWRYRDYVIDAFNRDLPYDRFLREQIAGDEIAPNDRSALVATGYLACGPKDIVMQNAKNRADELDDLVSTTGQALLGLTVNCARCHDHKYDPIKQSDYYRLSAIFAPTERREIELLTPEEQKTAKDLDDQMTPLRTKVQELKQQGTMAATAKGQKTPDDNQIAQALSEADRKAYSDAQAALKALENKRNGFPKTEIVTDNSRLFPDAHLLIRGDAGQPGPVVQPGFICSLPGGDADVTPAMALDKTTGRRRALADWIASPKNPLTARVWINRVWRQHFGRGLVNTPSNFGVSGELPTHPETLDWLAVTFMERGWRLKPIQKMILLSAAYQQDSVARPEGMKADPLNKYCWRMPVRRLEAEVIRDSLLSVAGSLNLQMGGPPVYPPIDPSLRADTFQGPNWKDGEDGPSTWRRSIYVKVKRSLLLPELEVFDCPEITYSVSARNITTTPTQALTLLNDPLILRQAGLFAQRIEKDLEKAGGKSAPADPRRQIARAYELALCRPPTPQELTLSLAYLQSRAQAHRPSPLTDFCHALLNLNEFVYVP